LNKDVIFTLLYWKSLKTVTDKNEFWCQRKQNKTNIMINSC